MANPRVEVISGDGRYMEDFFDMKGARTFAIFHLEHHKDLSYMTVYRGNKEVGYVVKTVRGYIWCTTMRYDRKSGQFVPVKGVPIKGDGSLKR